MRGAVNSYAINGAAPPSWVVLATAAAIATASVAATAPKRTTYASAHGDATVLVGKALAFANSEQRAPEGSYIIVPQEDRTASVPYEERTMVVV